MSTPPAHAGLTLTSAGRVPGLIVGLQVMRRAARSAALWGMIFAGYVAAQTLAYTSAYPTQQARDGLLRAYGNNVGLNALIGPARAINTIDGYASWRLLGILSILGSVWGLLTSTRLVRGEEDSGRVELLLSGQATRWRAAVQAAAGLGVGFGVLFVLTAVGTVLTGQSASVGFSATQSLYLSVTLVASAAVFLAVGMFTSQLVSSRRAAAALAGGTFGVAYALRMAADSDTRLHWLVWLSPLGWIEESRPLTDPNPSVLLPVAGLVAGLIVSAVILAGRRDVGSGTLRDRTTAPPRLALLNSAVGVALRLTRVTAVGWLLAIAAFGVLVGSIAQGSTRDATGSTGIAQAVGRLGGHGALVAVYLALTFLVAALLLALIAAGQLQAIRGEEAEGRLANLVVRPVARTRWLAGRLALATTLLAGAAVVVGVAAWVGAATQHTGVSFVSLLLAGINILPPALFVLGLGAFAFGAWPRGASAAVYGYLAWSFLVEFLGAAIEVNHWVVDTAIFSHSVPAPASDPDWPRNAVITGLALLGMAGGAALFNHRDIVSA